MYWLYVIGPDKGFPVKIGYAKNLAHRLKGIQSSHWETLTVHERFYTNNKGEAIKLEKLAHKRLADRKIRGEWFSLFADDAIKEIEELRKYQKYLQSGTENIEKSRKEDCFNVW